MGGADGLTRFQNPPALPVCYLWSTVKWVLLLTLRYDFVLAQRGCSTGNNNGSHIPIHLALCDFSDCVLGSYDACPEDLVVAAQFVDLCEVSL